MPKNTIIATIRKLVLSSGLKNTTLVVATSGGADSIAMLYLLFQISKEMGLTLIGAHLDHNIRGEESRRDAKFVVSVFKDLGLKYEIASSNIPLLSIQRKHSMENVAREERLKFLAATYHKYRASAICLGHNANDQTETILMHIVQGSGLKGLRGMQTISKMPIDGHPVTLFRPLLEQFKNNIEDYCALENLMFVTDSTNMMAQYTRNNFRLNIIPSLLKVNPSLHNALTRLSVAARLDDEFIEQICEGVWNSQVNFSNHLVSINTNQLNSLHKSVQHRLLTRAITVITGKAPSLSMAHSTSFSRLIAGPSGKVLTLPESILVKKQYENVLVYKAEQDISSQPELRATEIAIPGTTKIKGWEIKSHVYAGQSDKIIHTTTKFVAHLNSAMLDGTVYVRPRMNGDRFQPTGMQNSKKIQDFMVDEKIPKDLRNAIPLVVSKKGICWVVGHRIAEWAKQDKAHNTVVIKFTKTEY